MTARNPTEILRRWVAAYNAHDIDAMIALADPKIEIVPLGYTVTAPTGTSYHGHAGLRNLLEPGFLRYPGLRMEIGDEQVVGFSTIVPVTMVRDAGEAAPVRPTGAALFVFEEERVRLIGTFTTEREARAAAACGYGALSPREREVMSLLAKGQTMDEVAGTLFLSVLTVRTHVRNAKEKLGARTTYQAIAMAYGTVTPVGERREAIPIDR